MISGGENLLSPSLNNQNLLFFHQKRKRMGMGREVLQEEEVFIMMNGKWRKRDCLRMLSILPPLPPLIHHLVSKWIKRELGGEIHLSVHLVSPSYPVEILR